MGSYSIQDGDTTSKMTTSNREVKTRSQRFEQVKELIFKGKTQESPNVETNDGFKIKGWTLERNTEGSKTSFTSDETNVQENSTTSGIKNGNTLEQLLESVRYKRVKPSEISGTVKGNSKITEKDVENFDKAMSISGFTGKFQDAQKLKSKGFEFWKNSAIGDGSYYKNDETKTLILTKTDSNGSKINIIDSQGVRNEIYYNSSGKPTGGTMSAKQPDGTYTWFTYGFNNDGNKVIMQAKQGLKYPIELDPVQ